MKHVESSYVAFISIIIIAIVIIIIISFLQN